MRATSGSLLALIRVSRHPPKCAKRAQSYAAHACFTDGFDAGNLKTAKALLDELA